MIRVTHARVGPNVVVNGRPLLAGPFHLELGGNVTCS